MKLPYLQYAQQIIPSLHNQRRISFDVHYNPNLPKPLPVIVFIHGFNGFKDWGAFPLIAEYFAENGFVFIRMNLSHNGTTPENPTEIVDLEAYSIDKFSYGLDDIKSVIDFLYQEKGLLADVVNLDKLTLIGHSRGGGLAIMKTAEDERVKSLVTWASIAAINHFWTEEVVQKIQTEGIYWITHGRTKQRLPLAKAYYDDILANYHRIDFAQVVPRLKVPCMFIHGSADTTLPLEMLYKLHSYKPDSQIHVIENANHTFGAYHPYDKEELPEHTQELVRKTVEFLRQLS
ncbi:MAG: alpha/beta hydrolase [Microscillaceae bacterium]|nr:alpha/beta hydrolase [Microscillaceae bacterium]MDW8460667.1 alpha/beta fold hydrolase [Cytophagales bacterium]